MNLEIRDKWVKRLRSNGYEQGFGQLRRTVEEGVYVYCCLGVLCEMAVEAGATPPPREIEGIWFYGADHESEDDTGLPFSVRDWAGLSSGSGVITGGPVSSLVFANDAEHMSFVEIADIIENHEIR